jgi:ABC-type sugar transport system permease subunit/ABC-type glycerol-3-phosphate transport system substrate-binding protein
LSIAIVLMKAGKNQPGASGNALRSLFLLLAPLILFLAPLRAAELDIPVFYGGYGLSFYEETARLFEAERPGVKVNLYGDPRVTDRVRIRIVTGDLPDAVFPRELLIPALARAGKIRDLTPYLEGPNWEGDARWGDSFLPGALNSWRIDGGVYGVPLGYACWTVFYNQAMFREHGWSEPRTWEEFFALCERIKEAGIAPVSLTGIYQNYPDAFLRSAYFNLAGGDGWRALNEMAPGARTDSRYVRAAGVLQRITQNYTLKGWEGATHTAAQLGFLEGRAAMVVSGSWMIQEMKGKIPAGFELGVMNFPVFADGLADASSVQSSADCFFLFATGDPERERLTVDFLRFMTSRSRAESFVRGNDAPVAVRGVPLTAYSPQMRRTVEMITAARDGFNMPQVMLQTPALRQALTDHRLALMTGRSTPEQFAQEVESAAALDRHRAADPDHIEYRHLTGGISLLTGLAALGAWAGWRAWRKRVGPAVPGGPGSREAGDHRPHLSRATGLKFVGPAFLLYALLVLGPGLVAFGWAFTRWDGLSERTWAGWFNFKWLLFENDGFWFALRNNLYLMLVPAVVVLPLALLFAFLLHRGIWGAKVFRAVFLFPNLLGGIAATLLWLNAYEPRGGLVNAGLTGLGQLLGNEWLMSFDAHPWLSAANLYGALIPIYIWMACGFNLILFLAAMEGIDQQLYEAAEMDGAPVWRQFFAITLPLIWEVVLVAGVFIVIGGLNAFEMVWLLSSQDPGTSVHTLGTLMVTSMFKDFQVGRATAIAVVLFILVMAGSAFVLRGLRREETES